MTPRLADIAFVLEGVPGVVDVYALHDSPFEVAVRLEGDAGAAARAHYALLRVLTHEECRRVMMFELELPRGLAARATRLVLTEGEREAARARVPVSPPSFAEADVTPRRPKEKRVGAPFSALLVDCPHEAYAATVTALGAGARRVLEKDPSLAAETALSGDFDLILCPARAAFGAQGLLRRLYAEDPLLAGRVVLLVEPWEQALTLTRLDALDGFNTCLSPPLDPAVLLRIARAHVAPFAFTIPILPAREAGGDSAEPQRRVIVIDDEEATKALVDAMRSVTLDAVIAANPWAALDALSGPPPTLVLCSVSMRMGNWPLYRALWDAHPELKPRFVLIVGEGAAPPSNRESRPVLERPLTREAVEGVVARFGG